MDRELIPATVTGTVEEADDAFALMERELVPSPATWTEDDEARAYDLLPSAILEQLADPALLFDPSYNFPQMERERDFITAPDTWTGETEDDNARADDLLPSAVWDQLADPALLFDPSYNFPQMERDREFIPSPATRTGETEEEDDDAGAYDLLSSAVWEREHLPDPALLFDFGYNFPQMERGRELIPAPATWKGEESDDTFAFTERESIPAPATWTREEADDHARAVDMLGTWLLELLSDDPRYNFPQMERESIHAPATWTGEHLDDTWAFMQYGLAPATATWTEEEDDDTSAALERPTDPAQLFDPGYNYPPVYLLEFILVARCGGAIAAGEAELEQQQQGEDDPDFADRFRWIEELLEDAEDAFVRKGEPAAEDDHHAMINNGGVAEPEDDEVEEFLDLHGISCFSNPNSFWRAVNQAEAALPRRKTHRSTKTKKKTGRR
jgi:hypothetical protein